MEGAYSTNLKTLSLLPLQLTREFFTEHRTISIPTYGKSNYGNGCCHGIAPWFPYPLA